SFDRGYIVLDREWRPGDEIALDLPMPVRRIEAHPAVEADAGRTAIARGPLIYCLEGTDHDGAARRIAIPREANLEPEWDPDLLNGVVVLKGEGWIEDEAGSWKGRLYRTARPLRKVPVKAVPYYAWDNREPGDMVVWVPESAALVERPPIPTIATGAKAGASHCWERDTVKALNDGILPANSNDQKIPRFTWWDHKGTEEWVAYAFAEPAEVNGSEVYWFDDNGGCRLPESWTLEWRGAEGSWNPVEALSGYPVEANRFCRVTFRPVKAAGLRIAVKLRAGASGGILEWRLPE
ncbi:MAG: glycoside hydrolase family 127 protein, partial [Planctomycetes bacterium]|nr:glycoside hydrolase family 127 protein [Planctomycetota bacterium]